MAGKRIGPDGKIRKIYEYKIYDRNRLENCFRFAILKEWFETSASGSVWHTSSVDVKCQLQRIVSRLKLLNVLKVLSEF